MTNDDAEILRIVLARDALRKEAQLPRLDVGAELEKLRRSRMQEVSNEAFVPHAIIITERSRPTQINSAGWCGINRLLRIEIDQQYEDNAIHQVLSVLKKRIIELDCESWRGGIPWFGKAVYIALNYSKNRSVLYDLSGQIVKTFNFTIETGYSAVSIFGARPATIRAARSMTKV
jgi:hypothetical protein